MPSLWGSKKRNQQNEDEPSQDSPRDSQEQSHRREPTERDRLLPASPRRDGYLDPDDPAVSPYNLWSVRFTRYVSIVFLGLSFIWWVLLLVSIFISPPGLHTRGSGFFDFSYTTLTLGILLCSLLFFSAPSMAMRICQGILAVLLLIDLIIIVSVTRVRTEEGPPGISSVIWATLMAAWCVVTDRIVAWGKREEEERLTGRPETRRPLKTWLAVLIATIILIVYIIIAVLLTASLIVRSRDASLEMDGHRYFVEDGKFQVHLACIGNYTTDAAGNRLPTVLLEAAEEPVERDFEPWAFAAVQNATISRYCYWDRPGYGWSDNAPSPHSAGMAADKLSEALTLAGEQGPWIVVSGGYGSIVSRIFSARNYRKVVGIMLVDPLHEDLLPAIGAPNRGFVLWGRGILSPIGLPRIFEALFNGITREDRVYGRKAYQSGKFIKAQLQENLAADSFSRNEVATARTIQDSDTPLVVVSSGQHIKDEEGWRDRQEDLTSITGNLLHWDIVNNAPHFVWQSYEGRRVMEKRLGQLMKAYRKSS